MSADEFDIIRRLFAPLATSVGARELRDDVAVLEASVGLVLTTDAIVEGVHFRADDPIETVAKKALRVNLSDLAAKGAKPVGALLTLIWPTHRRSAEIADFARGLGEDLRLYDVPLLGGDTTSTPGPLTVSITLLGAPLGAGVPSRSDARSGDDVWITGTIGDAWLGHEILSGAWEPPEGCRDNLVLRYRVPEPRMAFAPVIAAHARASMDVSDGLLADASKLARASGVGVCIEAERLPLSTGAQAWRGQNEGWGRLLNWGDDYEVLFTADPSVRDTIIAAAAQIGVNTERIGLVKAGEGARIVDSGGGTISFAQSGHEHQLGQ